MRGRAAAALVAMAVGSAVLAAPSGAQAPMASPPALLVSEVVDEATGAAQAVLVETSGSRVVAPPPATAAAVDAAGTRIAVFEPVPGSEPPTGSVVIRPLDGPGEVRSAQPISSGGGGRLVWLPDGTAVLVADAAGVRRVDAATGTVSTIPGTAPEDVLVDASADAVLVARPAPDVQQQATILLADGTAVPMPVEGQPYVKGGRFSPDGTRIAFVSTFRSSRGDVETLRFALADGSGVTPEWTPTTMGVFGPVGSVDDVVWLPDSSAVLAVGLGEVLALRSPAPAQDSGEDGPGDRTVLVDAGIRAVGTDATGQLAVVAIPTDAGTRVDVVPLAGGDRSTIARLGPGTEVGATVPARPGPSASAAEAEETAVRYALSWLAGTEGLVDTVLLGRADGFADSLAAGGLRGALSAPLLLTPGDALHPDVAAELDRLDVQRVILLGGETAISTAVADELAATGHEVTRIAGPSRVETALLVADQVVAATGAPPTEVILARAFDDPGDPTRAWADSLAAGARAGARTQPLLLTDTDALSPSTAAWLRDLAALPVEGGGRRLVTIAGGPPAVSDAVVAEVEAMGFAVERRSGPNRFASAVALAGERTPGFGGPVHVVDGTAPLGWAAGLTATGAPVVLVDGQRVPDETAAFLQEGRDASPTQSVVCGPDLDAATCEAVTALGQRGG